MLIFISGGVRSGKSSLGERLVTGLAGGRKIYLATSEVYDEEMEQRVQKHRQDRLGKGFLTMEKSRDIGALAPSLIQNDSILLDCLGSLAANELFGDQFVERATGTVEALADKISGDILRIRDASGLLVIISNEVFSDGRDYADMTGDYVDLMGLLHRRLVQEANVAVECAAGQFLVHKGSLPIEYSGGSHEGNH